MDRQGSLQVDDWLVKYEDKWVRNKSILQQVHMCLVEEVHESTWINIVIGIDIFQSG